MGTFGNQYYAGAAQQHRVEIKALQNAVAKIDRCDQWDMAVIYMQALEESNAKLRAVLADCQAHLACNAVTDDLVALYGRVRSALGA